MALLINKADIEAHFQVAMGRTEAELNKFILDAQTFDLKRLMPEAFYHALVSKAAEEPYLSLMKGKTYTYESVEYSFEGVKVVLVYYAYARYMLRGSLQDTSFGMVTKTNGQSEPATFQERRDWHDEYKSNASLLWQGCEAYILRNINDFPLWTACAAPACGGAKQTFKTRVIK